MHKVRAGHHSMCVNFAAILSLEETNMVERKL